MKCPKCQTDNPADSKFCKECATRLPASGGIGASQTETLLPPREDLATGSTFAGRYQVIEELGQGGMGKVYKVLDKETNSRVALKLIRPGIIADKNVVQRFKNELKMARDISHKNICRVYDLGNEAENYFYTMEYVHGEDLRELVRRTRRLDVGTAISIGQQVSAGLAEAHKLGIIHRDLKPGNIMIDRDGNAKVMDFGIARSLRTKGITGPGAAIGTPEYMSPEQAEGKDSDQRADIYALGIILYEMVTGTVPFEGETPLAIGLKHRTALPENPKKLNAQIPDDLGRLILKCLEKKRENRPQTAGDVLNELNKIEQRLPTTDRVIPKRRPITSREITVHFTLRKIVGPGLALAAVAVGIILVVLLTNRRPPRQPLLPSHKQLTFTGDAYWPSITPDGQFLAYVKKAPTDEVALMVQDLASGQALEVLRARDCRNPRWTPDGSELSFWATMQDSSSGIYIIPRLGVGATPRRLEAGGFIAWSPDGSQFATCQPDSREIRLTNKKTGESVSFSLQSSVGQPDDIDWSPNGRFLLLSTFYESHRFGIWTLSLDGKEQNQIVKEDTDIGAPRWTPQGNAIYYSKYVPPISDQLVRMGVSEETGRAAKSPELLALDLGETGDGLTFTNDGRRLVYPKRLGYANLWLARMRGPGESPAFTLNELTTGGLYNLTPSISPDGELLAFSRGKGQPFNLFIMPVAGGSPRQLTFFDSLIFYPAWSPQGDEIAFSSNEGGTATIWKVSARGGNPSQFAGSRLADVFTWLSWSPGPDILYPNLERDNYSVLDPVTAKVTSLLKSGLFKKVFWARYSPDLSRIVVGGERDTVSSGVWVISSDGHSDALSMKRELLPVGWSADGKWFYLSEPARAVLKIFRVAVDGGRDEVVLEHQFTTEMGEPIFFHVVMTSDAKRFVFPLQRTVSDIYMLENFDPALAK